MADYTTSVELFDAIHSGEVERVRALISTDPALVDARSNTGESAILAAVYNRQKEIANLLVARGALLTLAEAAASGELERVERLLDRSAGAVNDFTGDGWTPLHLAAFFGHMGIAELLLSHGADVTARSKNQTANTPLHAALASGHSLLAGVLIGHGADVNAGDSSGWCPLHIAAASNNLDAMRALLSQGADVSAANADGVTPLALAAERGHREAAALLERYGS